jgi:hypothetical protein
VRNHRPGSTGVGLLIALAAGGFAGCGGTGSSSDVSAASLTPRLLPASSLPGFRQQRRFDWSDPVNLVGEGVPLPEITQPSSGVKAFTDAGFRGAAGERLARGTPPDESDVTVGVVKLKSPDGARQVRDWMHGQDLQQPCFTACSYTPRNLRIPGVPTATAVQQVPNIPPPPGGGTGPSPRIVGQGPPTHYRVEFTVGPYLYFASTDGSPKDARAVVTATQLYYQRVQKLPD